MREVSGALGRSNLKLERRGEDGRCSILERCRTWAGEDGEQQADGRGESGFWWFQIQDTACGLARPNAATNKGRKRT